MLLSRDIAGFFTKRLL